jgi:hypothetical protein
MKMVLWLPLPAARILPHLTLKVNALASPGLPYCLRDGCCRKNRILFGRWLLRSLLKNAFLPLGVYR